MVNVSNSKKGNRGNVEIPESGLGCAPLVSPSKLMVNESNSSVLNNGLFISPSPYETNSHQKKKENCGHRKKKKENGELRLQTFALKRGENQGEMRY
ncbi:hypothetical protein NMG60_11021400 [Bertholletia excelsa]